jgi:reactive intermediate/imine deaminase
MDIEMPSATTPPFAAAEADRREIWEMLVLRDTRAFLAGDWEAVAADFIADGFHGLDARKRQRPDEWRLGFPTLDAYRREWLRQSGESARIVDAAAAQTALLQATTLEQIDIDGDCAVARKKFNGSMPNRDGTHTTLRWQTLYVCRKQQGRWKIASFVGYLPCDADQDGAAHFVAAQKQHRTAGPYTPVVGVNADARLFVISGQAPLDLEGRVVGGTIQEQSRVTLENCRTQLRAAGCDLADVFKATVYLTDLANWSAFNAVYKEFMKEPWPARTAVQCGLLPGFLVEIEMWAARS